MSLNRIPVIKPSRNFDAANLIPIVVGVSGHIDLIESEIPSIRNAVNSELNRIDGLASHSPKLLITALAKGADQLVAAEAMQRGWEVAAILPMPLVDFLEDFETEEERRQFKSLLSRCVSSYALPWATELDFDISTLRDQQYRNQGIYIARQAQVVICIWDGRVVESGDCGTSLVVRICRQGPPPLDGAVLAAPETTGMIHIPVRREKYQHLPVIQLMPRTTDHMHVSVFKEIEGFNRALMRCRLDPKSSSAESAEWILPSGSRHRLGAGSRYVLERYAEADVLARTSQKRRKQAILAASIISVIAAISQGFYATSSAQPWLVAYGVSIILAYGIYIAFFKLPFFRIEDKFLEYRAFAEAARVQLFWRLSGLNIHVAEYYLQLTKSEMGWVREAVRCLAFKADLIEPKIAPLEDIVYEYWLLGQERYFVGVGSDSLKGSALQRRILAARYEVASICSFAIGIGLVLVSASGYLIDEIAFLRDISASFSASFILIGGVIKGFSASMGYEEESVNFEKAGAVFRNARKYIDGHKSIPEKIQSCVIELGRFALSENADWLLKHKRNAFRVEK